MTHTTYIPNNNANTINSTSFFSKLFTPSKPKSDSEKLDDLILSSLIKKNPYMKDLYKTPKKECPLAKLFGKKSTAKETNNAIDLISALYYLTHEYKPETYSGNYYTIEIGDTTIKVFDDEIQIDDILLSIDDSKDFAEFLPKEKQKLIIDFVINIDL